MILISIYYPIYALCMLNIKVYITCTVHDLGALGVTQNIQVMGYLQVDYSFTTSSWT